jgi:hypothetical protein
MQTCNGLYGLRQNRFGQPMSLRLDLPCLHFYTAALDVSGLLGGRFSLFG